MRKLIPVALVSLLLGVLALAQTTRVGPLPSADSLAINQRVGRTGETITQQAGGDNKERVRRGGCYWAVCTDFAPGTAIGTTAFCVVYNPQNSGTLVIINRVYVDYATGTLGACRLFHCLNSTTTQTAPSGGNLATNVPALAGSNNASVAVVRSGATVVTPAGIAQFAYLPSGFTTTSIVPILPVYEEIRDSIQLLPGTSYQIQGQGAAGTSPTLTPSVFWEEQPLLNGAP